MNEGVAQTGESLQLLVVNLMHLFQALILCRSKAKVMDLSLAVQW